MADNATSTGQNPIVFFDLTLGGEPIVVLSQYLSSIELLQHVHENIRKEIDCNINSISHLCVTLVVLTRTVFSVFPVVFLPLLRHNEISFFEIYN